MLNIFVQIKLNKTNFAIHVWWALIEEVTPCAIEIEMACHDKKEVACCVRGYHVYKDIWAVAIGEELVCNMECTCMYMYVSM